MNTANKSTMSPTLRGIIIGLCLGGALSFVAYPLLTDKDIDSNANKNTASEQQKPLYWVAPMDANYRKDKPGKSPMGMDLVPVFSSKATGVDEGEGTITISPNVINNLGVRNAKASYGTLQTEINTVGYVTYDQDKLVHIHPRVQGWIEKLYVKASGDSVEKGQALYEIYSPELVNAQEEYLLALDRNNRRLITAAENRLMSLQLPKIVIENLRKNKKVQQRIRFYSPQNGVVENLNIREGFFVKPGSTLMSIGDLSEVWVEAEVFERQAAQVRTGTPVTMTLDYLPGKTWQGKVDYIYPTLDAKTRTVKVRLRFKNETGDFKPNMFAEIAIHTKGNENALLIPREALIRTGNQDRVVLALGQGSFKSIAVTTGRYDSESVEILAGLNDGDDIVSSAQFLLDSESSKSSDFKRMNHDDKEREDAKGSAVHSEDQTTGHQSDSHKVSSDKEKSPQYSSASTSGVIKSLMIEHGMITISRAAIEKWDRPPATVDFITDETVMLQGLSVGSKVTFTFEIRNGRFVIIELSEIIVETPITKASLTTDTSTLDVSMAKYSNLSANITNTGGSYL